MPVGIELEQRQELADVMARLRFVSHLDAAVDEVAAPSSDSLPFQVARFHEVGDDPLGGAFGDADLLGDLAQPHLGVPRNAEQDVRVICQEGPAFHPV